MPSADSEILAGSRMWRRAMRSIASGMVAENSIVCRSSRGGRKLRMFSISSWKPIDSISSHSSSTSSRMSLVTSVLRRMWSSTRPGVPATICAPACSASICGFIGAPP